MKRGGLNLAASCVLLAALGGYSISRSHLQIGMSDQMTIGEVVLMGWEGVIDGEGTGLAWEVVILCSAWAMAMLGGALSIVRAAPRVACGMSLGASAIQLAVAVLIASRLSDDFVAILRQWAVAGTCAVFTICVMIYLGATASSTANS